MELILQFISAHVSMLVLQVLGGLVVLGQSYVALQPLFVKLEALPIIGQVLVGLAAFAPIQRKLPPQ
jgi:hypothetical protein